MASVALGPGTLTLGATPTDFSCEVMGGKITHEYETTSESRTPLCGTVKAAVQVRKDGAAFDIENDLSATGLYKYLLTNDLATVAFAFTPNTAKAAKWAGSIQVTLPSEIGASAFGEPIVSSVEWAGVGLFTFTNATLLEDETQQQDEAA